MPAMQTIIVNDDKTTPVAHNFAPVTTDGQVGHFANRSSTIPQGFEKLSIEVAAPKSTTAAYRVAVSMTTPIVAAVDGQDQVVRQDKSDCVLYFSQNSSVQERKDLLAMLKNLFADASFKTAVSNLEPYY